MIQVSILAPKTGKTDQYLKWSRMEHISLGLRKPEE